MLEVPGEQNEFELTQLAPVGSALFRLVKQLELEDFCTNGLVGRQQARPSRHHSLIFFWFSVSPFLLGRLKR